MNRTQVDDDDVEVEWREKARIRGTALFGFRLFFLHNTRSSSRVPHLRVLIVHPLWAVLHEVTPLDTIEFGRKCGMAVCFGGAVAACRNPIRNYHRPGITLCLLTCSRDVARREQDNIKDLSQYWDRGRTQGTQVAVINSRCLLVGQKRGRYEVGVGCLCGQDLEPSSEIHTQGKRWRARQGDLKLLINSFFVVTFLQLS